MSSMVEQVERLAPEAKLAVDKVVTQADAASERSQSSRFAGFGLLIAAVVPVVLWFAPLHLDRPAQKAIAVSSFMIIAWITHAPDHAVTGLIGCYLFWAL